MRTLRTASLLLLAAVLLACWSLGATGGAKDQELFNQGKIAIFDKNWEGARTIFQRVIQEYPQSTLVPQAYYYIARCYQFQSNEAEAIRAYDVFMQKYPNEPFLPDEARNSVVEISASLVERGDTTYRNRLVASLTDSRKEVRYFTAIRMSRLKDSKLTAMAVPVLREIVKNEKEGELADRARIALLRLDPKELSPKAEMPEKRSAEKAGKSEKGSKDRNVRMFHLVVYKAGATQPTVELNLPVSLAQMAIAALDEQAKAELRKKGVDIENVWESLKQMGPANILTIRNGEDMVKLWID